MIIAHKKCIDICNTARLAHLWRTRTWYWIGAAIRAMSSSPPCRLRQPEVRHWAWKIRNGRRDSTQDSLRRNIIYIQSVIYKSSKKTVDLDWGTSVFTCMSTVSKTCWQVLRQTCCWCKAAPKNSVQVSPSCVLLYFAVPTLHLSWWSVLVWPAAAPAKPVTP